MLGRVSLLSVSLSSSSVLLMTRLLRMMSIVVVCVSRLPIHVRRVIAMVTRIVLRRLVHRVYGRRHASVHVYFVTRVQVPMVICLLSLGLFLLVFVSFFLYRIHTVVLIGFSLIVLLFLSIKALL
jgi:hypothetical protein